MLALPLQSLPGCQRTGRSPVQIWSLRRVAEEVVAVVAASTQSLHRPAQISASPLAHTGEAAARRTRERSPHNRHGRRHQVLRQHPCRSAHQLRSWGRGLALPHRRRPTELLRSCARTARGSRPHGRRMRDALRAEALRSVRELRPEVALVDIDLGTDSGFDLARRLADDVDGSPPAGDPRLDPRRARVRQADRVQPGRRFPRQDGTIGRADLPIARSSRPASTPICSCSTHRSRRSRTASAAHPARSPSAAARSGGCGQTRPGADRR